MASLIRSIRDWMSRVTGFSTPLFGLSWNPEEITEAKHDTPGDSPILTPGECAQVLRIDEQSVINLLESGNLRGLSVVGEWRVTSSQVTDFLHKQSKAKELEVFTRKISDPIIWATELRQWPEMMKKIQTGEYPEDSVGKWLQDSLKALEEDGAEFSED